MMRCKARDMNHRHAIDLAAIIQSNTIQKYLRRLIIELQRENSRC